MIRKPTHEQFRSLSTEFPAEFGQGHGLDIISQREAPATRIYDNPALRPQVGGRFVDATGGDRSGAAFHLDRPESTAGVWYPGLDAPPVTIYSLPIL